METLDTSRSRPFEAEFISNASNLPGFCHCAALWEAADGALVAVWYRFPEAEHRNGVIMLSRRPAGGNWGAPSVVLYSAANSYANPVLFSVAGRLGLMFVSLGADDYWTKAVAQLCWSDDEGRTWGPSRPMGLAPGMMIRHPPVEIDGRLLLPVYEEATSTTVMAVAEAPFESWREESRLRGAALIQASLVRYPGGEIGAFFRPAGDDRCVWRCRALADRRSWSVPVRTPLPSPPAGIAALALGGDAVLVVYNHSTVHRRTPLAFAVSPDGGVRWETTGVIDASPFEVSYPFLTRGRDGSVHGVYTYNRRLIKHFRIDARVLQNAP